jgi:cobalt/nickel transport system permease protein
MHIPDGFVDLRTAAVTGALSAGGLAGAIYGVKKYFKARVIAMMGVMGALIFALQMINFTIPGGTSGHLLGGALAAIILGPHAGVVVITVVLIVQALIFMDGGIAALGSNIFNMAIIGVYSSFFVYWLLKKLSGSRWMFFVAVTFASWISVVSASLFAAIELGISGTYAMGITIKAMLGVHSVIGLGEAAITMAVTAFVFKVRPEIILTLEGETS